MKKESNVTEDRIIEENDNSFSKQYKKDRMDVEIAREDETKRAIKESINRNKKDLEKRDNEL